MHEAQVASEWTTCTYVAISCSQQLWEEQGLDLELIPYGCMATGPMIGVIEVVKNARTIAEVSSFSVSVVFPEPAKLLHANMAHIIVLFLVLQQIRFPV